MNKSFLMLLSFFSLTASSFDYSFWLKRESLKKEGMIIDVTSFYNETKDIIEAEYKKFKLENPQNSIEDFYEKIVPIVQEFWKDEQKKQPVGFLLSIEEALYQEMSSKHKNEKDSIFIHSLRKTFDNYLDQGVYQHVEQYHGYTKVHCLENEKSKSKRLLQESLEMRKSNIAKTTEVVIICGVFFLGLCYCLIEPIMSIKSKQKGSRVRKMKIAGVTIMSLFTASVLIPFCIGVRSLHSLSNQK